MFGLFDPHFTENTDDWVLALLSDISCRYADARKHILEGAKQMHYAKVNLCETYGKVAERVGLEAEKFERQYAMLEV